MKTKLTVDAVRVLTTQVPPGGETIIYDTQVPRFALRVRPPTAPGRPWASLWLIRYVGPDGRQRKFKIGTPASLDLDDARRAARKMLAIVDQGGDPAATKAAGRVAWSVQQAIDAYLSSQEFGKKTAKVQANDKARLTLHVAHHLGREAIGAIDVPQAKRLLRSVERDTRSNRRKRRIGGPGSARKVLRLLSALLSWCVNEGQLARNPLNGALKLDGDGVRETVVTEGEQYARIFAAADALVAAGKMRPASRAFIVTAALTGMRRGELQGLRWRDVDLGRGRITLTTSKGAKLARGGVRTETVALPPFAAAAMAAIRPEDAGDDDQVFVPMRGTLYKIDDDWRAVRTMAGLPAALTLHGLRHSAGTVAVLAGLSAPEVQKMLRHRNISTTAKYIHLADRARLQDRAFADIVGALPKADEPAVA